MSTSFTITFGWWLLPLVITVASMAWAIPVRDDERRSGSYFPALDGLESAFRTGVATIVSLIAWLVWALLR